MQDHYEREQSAVQPAQPSPPFALYKFKRDQLLLGAGALTLTTGADIIFHANSSGVFFGLLGSGMLLALSDDILDAVIPGRYAKRIATGEIAPEAPAPNRPKSSAVRLFQLWRHRHTRASDEEELKEVEEAQQQEDGEPSSSPVTQPAPHGNASVALPSALPHQGTLPERLFPLYHEKETLRLGRVAATGQRFDPHFNDLLGKGIISSAVMGSGMSMANGLIVERAALAGMPTVVLDHKGEYASITELNFAKGLRAGADASFDFHLTEERVDEFVRLIIDRRYQAIIDLPSYGLNWISRARIVSAVGKALMAYSAQRQRRGILLIPTLVVLDEAQLYLPENIKYLPSEAKANLDVLSDLNNAFFAMASNGRSNGYTTIISTPSLTYVAKAFIKSSQIYFFLRHSEKNDLDECMRMLDPHVTREQMETMPIGCGVVKGFTPTPMIVQFDTKKSRDLAQTPMLERLSMPIMMIDEPMEPLPLRQPPVPMRQQPTSNPAKSGVSAIEKLTAILAESFTEEELLAAIDRLPDRQIDPVNEDEPPADPFAALPLTDQRKIEWAKQLWEKGEASVRKLEEASGWSNYETRRIIKLMKELGLIESDE